MISFQQNFDAAMSADERKLRELLAVRVAGASLYTDDGELQDGSMQPWIDFLRDPPFVIETKLIERGRIALEAALKATEFIKDVKDDFDNRL